MFNYLANKVFGRGPAAPAAPAIAGVKLVPPQGSGRSDQVHVQYPPQDPGFVCPEAADLLRAQADIMGMLRIHAACAPAMFKDRYEQPILNLAAYIVNLPATASGVFSGEGGLMRACVEMAFNSFRASDGRIFTGASGVEERHLLEGRWRYVCFAAGLMYPLGASIEAMQVIDAQGKRWSPELDSLESWVGPGKRYWVTWLHEDVQPGPSSIMGMLLHKILGRPNIDWLNDGSSDLIKRLLEIITGSALAGPLIATNVVQSIWVSVHMREVARRHQNYGRLTVGSHISPYIIDAMVVLTRDVWIINEKTVFADATGVHLEWPAAGRDIIDYCKAHAYPGVPSSEAALLTMLSANKIIVGGLDGVAMVEIANADGEIVAAVKLAKPGLLVDDPAVFATAKSRPVAIEEVIAGDPLTSASPENSPIRKKPAKKEVAPAEVVNRPTLDTIEIDEKTGAQPTNSAVPPESTTAVEPAAVPFQAPASEAKNPLGAAPVEATEATAGQSMDASTEGAEIKYAGLVDKDVAAKLKPHSIEILGKVIHAWREKTDLQYVMRTTTVGAAVEKDFLLMCSSRGIDSILEFAAAGLLYIDPTRPGIKIHQIATVDGGQKKVDCIVFSRGSVKLLGLN